MQGLYEIIRDSKKILMVFPMFYGSMPGEFKVMIDRFFAKSRIEVVDGKNKYGSTWPKGRNWPIRRRSRRRIIARCWPARTSTR